MITRSAEKKSFAYNCERMMPLSSGGKKKKKLIKSKLTTKSPVSASSNEIKNIQSPVFNVHIYVPSTTNNPNDLTHYQPTIHLHFDELVNKLCNGQQNNVETMHETSKVESQVQENCNFEAQDDSCKSMVVKLPMQNKASKKLSFTQFKENSDNKKIEPVLNSAKKNKKNENSLLKLPCRGQTSVRRSSRQAKNKKFLKTLKDLVVNESFTRKTKNKKPVKNIPQKKTSNSLGNIPPLKKAVVVLQDIRKIMKDENISFYNDVINDEKIYSVNLASTNDSLKKVEEYSCDSSNGNANEQNLIRNENNKQDLKENSNDLNKISGNNKYEDIYSLVYLSDNESSIVSNSETDFLNKCLFSENIKKKQFMNRKKNCKIHKKDFCKTAHNLKNDSLKHTKNNEVNNCDLLDSKIYDCTTLTKSDLSDSHSKNEGLFLSLQDIKENNNTIVSSTSIPRECCVTDNNPGSEEFDSNSKRSYMSNSYEEVVDEHEIASVGALGTENINGRPESKNENLLKNIVEENNLSKESDDCNEINVSTPGFQLDLIRKEMEKRNMNVKKGTCSKKSSKQKTASEIGKKVLENPSVTKKKKLSNETSKKSTEKNVNNTSLAENYIPLQVSGHTKFAVVQLNKINNYSIHSAKSFKEEMLFGKRVLRYKDSKYFQIHRLKKQAATKRSK